MSCGRENSEIFMEFPTFECAWLDVHNVMKVLAENIRRSVEKIN